MTFNKFLKNVYYYYPIIVKSLFKLTGILYNLIQTLIVSIGALVILIALVIVEHHRFSIALSFFEQEPLYISFGAAFLVMSILFFSVQIVVIDHQHKYSDNKQHRFSLRFLVKDVAYFLGISRDFSPIEKPPSHKTRQLKTLLIVVSMILAAIGSLQEQITENKDLPFIQGIEEITINADFESGVTTITVVLFTFVIVLLSSNATANITKRALEVLEEVENDRQTIITKTQEENTKNIYSVRDLTEHLSRALSSRYANHPMLQNDDLIDIEKHDFFDSITKKWLRDGEGYSNQTTLIKNIDKVIESRTKHSQEAKNE